MRGTRHEDTMDIFIHCAHNVDLLSCCIEHGLVGMARSRHRPQCMRCMRDNTVYHVPGT